MKAQSPYSQVPSLLATFAPEYQTPTFHLHGRNIDSWTALMSVFRDQHFEINKMAKKILKGAFIGFTLGISLRHLMFKGPKSWQMNRLFLLNKGSPNLSPMRGYTAFGGVMGLTWYIIKDLLFCPHGNDTWMRQVGASALFGGILIATIFHPINFFYGCSIGALVGGFYLDFIQPSFPRGFQLKIKNVNQITRDNLMREDQEYQMGVRNVIYLKYHHYPL